LGDVKGLVELYIYTDNWKDAFLVANQHKELMEILKLPYAEYLCKNDRYEDALKVYKECNRLDLSQKMLNIMTSNAAKEARYKDAAKLFW
jgi:intraflagellar transport protein 122